MSLELKTTEQNLNNEQEKNAVENKPAKGSKVGIIVLLILLFCLLLTYGIGCYYFSGHYFPATVINGMDVSYLDQSSAETQIEKKINAYELSIVGREDCIDHISTADVDATYDATQMLSSVLGNQNCYLWPVSYFTSHTYDETISLSYNEEMMKTKLSSLVFLQKSNQKEPVNAHIGDYVPEDHAYELVEEYNGTVLDQKRAKECIKKAFESYEQEIVLDEYGLYKDAAVKSDDKKLQKLYQFANTIAKTNITYDWNGREVILDGKTISQWVTIDERKVELDEQAVSEWVTAQAEKYDTYYEKVKFTTIDGYEKELKRGAFGWRTNQEEESRELFYMIRKGTVESREPIYKNVGYKKGEDDIGNSYVEINLSAQHLYLWMDGEVVLEDDFVSGNMSNGNGTPGGVFGITYKQKDAVLRGANYTTPVKYWMPFNGNIGMHDATWRRAFGGDIFMLSGSHGCINMRLSTAKEMYNYMEKGFPVICYY